MFIKVSYVLIIALLVTGCGQKINHLQGETADSTSKPPAAPTVAPTSAPASITTPIPTPIPTAIPTATSVVISLKGSYCTVVDDYLYRSKDIAPFDIECIQKNGEWLSVAGFPETVNKSFGQLTRYDESWQEPLLNRASNGDLVVTYKRGSGAVDASPYAELIIARFNELTGWSQVGTTAINTDAQGALIEPFSQFQGTTFEFNGVLCHFWTPSKAGGGVLSCYKNGAWVSTSISDSKGLPFRHPEVTTTSSVAYLYFGEPTPKVYKYNGTTLTQVGTVPTSTSTWPLYTSLTEYAGKPVFAVVSGVPNNRNYGWAISFWTTQVYSYNGTQWTAMGSTIEDTPSHDQIKPYLFTLNGSLYIMYADYTTVGVPTVMKNLRCSLRVKKWNGTSWERVGGESDPINISMRLEFLNDQGTLYFQVVQPVPNGTGFRSIVMGWTLSTGFGYLGPKLMSDPDLRLMARPRPGAVIKL